MKEELSVIYSDDNQKNKYDISVASLGDIYKTINQSKDLINLKKIDNLSQEKKKEKKLKLLLKDPDPELIEKADYSIYSEDQDVSNLVNKSIYEKIKVDEYRNDQKHLEEEKSKNPHIENLYFDMVRDIPDNNRQINVKYLRLANNPPPRKYSHVKSGRINPVKSTYSIKPIVDQNAKNHKENIKEFVLEAEKVEINLTEVKKLKSPRNYITKYNKISDNDTKTDEYLNYTYNTVNNFNTKNNNLGKGIYRNKNENMNNYNNIQEPSNYVVIGEGYTGNNKVNQYQKRVNGILPRKSAVPKTTRNKSNVYLTDNNKLNNNYNKFNISNTNTIYNKKTFNNDINQHIEFNDILSTNKEQNPNTAEFAQNINNLNNINTNAIKGNLNSVNYNNNNNNIEDTNIQFSNSNPKSIEYYQKNYLNSKTHREKNSGNINIHKDIQNEIPKASSKENRALLKQVEEFYANTKNLLSSSDNNLPAKVNINQLVKSSMKIESQLENYQKNYFDAHSLNNSSMLSKQNNSSTQKKNNVRRPNSSNYMLKNSINRYKKREPKNFKLDLNSDERKKFEEKLELLHIEMRNTMDNLNQVNNSSEKFHELTKRWHELTQTIRTLSKASNSNNINNLNQEFQDFDNQIYDEAGNLVQNFSNENPFNNNNNTNNYYPNPNEQSQQENDFNNNYENNQEELFKFSNMDYNNTNNKLNNNTNNNNYSNQNFYPNNTKGNNNTTHNLCEMNNQIGNNTTNNNFYTNDNNSINNNKMSVYNTNSNNFTNVPIYNDVDDIINVLNSQQKFLHTTRNNQTNNNDTNNLKIGDKIPNKNSSGSFYNPNTISNSRGFNPNSSGAKNVDPLTMKNFEFSVTQNPGGDSKFSNSTSKNFYINNNTNHNNEYNNPNINHIPNEYNNSSNGFQNNSVYNNPVNENSNTANKYNYNMNVNNASQKNFYNQQNKTPNMNKNGYSLSSNNQNSNHINSNQYKSTQAFSNNFVSNNMNNNFNNTNSNFNNTNKDFNNTNNNLFNTNSNFNFSNSNFNKTNTNYNNSNSMGFQNSKFSQPNQTLIPESENLEEINNNTYIKNEEENKNQIISEYENKFIINQHGAVFDDRYTSYDIKMPLEYYHDYAKKNEPPKERDWCIRPHHTESIIKNKEVIPDDIMNTKYISYYAEAEKPEPPVTRLKILNEVIGGLQENIDILKKKMHQKAITDKDFRGVYKKLISLKEEAKSEFVPGKVFERLEVKSAKSVDILNNNNADKKNYSEFFNQNEEIGKTNNIIKTYESLLNELRTVEKEKILRKRKEEYEKIRPPCEKWYEMKSKNFQGEFRRNTVVLNSGPEYFKKLKLLQSKNLY